MPASSFDKRAIVDSWYDLPDDTATASLLARAFVRNGDRLSIADAFAGAPIVAYRRTLTPERSPGVHRHDFFEMVLIIEGEVIESIHGAEYRFAAGDVIFLDHLVEHAVVSFPKGAIMEMGVAFAPSAVDGSLDIRTSRDVLRAFSLIEPFFYLPELKRYGISLREKPLLRVYTAWCALIHAFSMHEQNTRSVTHHFDALLSTLVDEYHARYAARTAATPVAQALRHLNGHFCETLDVKRLCAVAGLGKSSLYARFLKETGRSPLDHITALRMAKAKVLLATSSLPVTRIAAELGYDDTQYFHRVFKKSFGVTPQVHRRKNATPSRASCS
ncbi:MAG: AraC family transcriptional regulator [Spirochaetota bacterium]